MKPIAIPLWLTLLWISSPVFAAEGAEQLGPRQAIVADIGLLVDILDPEREAIRWDGTGTAQVIAPSGAEVATLSPGQSVGLGGLEAGAYGLVLSSDQTIAVPWNITVLGQTDDGGRVHSYDWSFRTGSFDESYSAYASFYAIVPGGDGATSAVIELALDGLSGYVYRVNANRVGVVGEAGGQSVPSAGNSVVPEFPIYLRPPSLATYSRLAPELAGLSFEAVASSSISEAGPGVCDQIAAGASEGTFSFTSNVDGTYQLRCDLDRDGQFETTDTSDALLIGRAEAGSNSVQWDVRDRYGAEVGPGTYQCVVDLNVGEFHYVGADIETSYPGMRLFEVLADGSRRGLPMFWDDNLVQTAAQSMPDGQAGRASSGDAGIESGDYSDAVVPNVNARSWGAFNSGGKGNNALLDTYTFLSSVRSVELTVTVADTAVDTDGDGLSDFEEECIHGTDPLDEDSDDDGVLDGEQYTSSGASSSGDGGLESNGDLALALGIRAVMRSRSSPQLGWVRSGSSSGLQSRLPTLPGLVRLDTSPLDLLEVTNAVDVVGADYVSPGQGIRAAVLMIETEGEGYEHSKALCDRAAGAVLTNIDAAEVEGTELLVSTLVDTAAGTRDRAIVFRLYETESGWAVVTSWLLGDYPVPAPGQRVVEVQVWSPLLADTRDLAAQVLRAFAASPMNQSGRPAAFIRSVRMVGPRVEVDVAEAPDGARLLGRAVDNDGDRVELDLGVVPGGEGRLDLWLEPFRELRVELRIGGELVDETWTSDGVWIPATSAAGTSVPGWFSSECWDEEPSEPVGDARVPWLSMSGCAQANSPDGSFGGVARHLASGPLDLTDAGGVHFRADSSESVRVCVESSSEGAYACTTIPQSSDTRWVRLTPEDFIEGAPEVALSAATLVSFTSTDARRLRIRDLTFGPVAETASDAAEFEGWPPSTEALACASAKGPDALVGLLMLLGTVLIRRRPIDV